MLARPTTQSASQHHVRQQSGLHNLNLEPGSLDVRLPVTTIRLAPGHGPLVSDQLTVFNGVIGLIAAASQTQNDLIDLNVSPKHNTAAIDNACKAVKSFKATIQVLYKVLRQLETNKLRNQSRAAFIKLDSLIGILTDCALIISNLGNILLGIFDDSNQLSISATVLCARHGSTIIQDANSIRNAEVVITKIASVLQVGDEFEALRHRDQADGLVNAIVETDIDLADRMQQMQDVFGARAVVPQTRLEEVTNHAPPGYSVPVSRTEELPEYSQATNASHNPDGSVTIRPDGLSVFSGLTLADISILSLIPLPLHSGELRYGELYSNEYCRSVNEELANLAEKNLKQKNLQLSKVLGLRNVGSNWDEEGFARRVGLQYDDYSRSDGRLRSRPQPEMRTSLT